MLYYMTRDELLALHFRSFGGRSVGLAASMYTELNTVNSRASCSSCPACYCPRLLFMPSLLLRDPARAPGRVIDGRRSSWLPLSQDTQKMGADVRDYHGSNRSVSRWPRSSIGGSLRLPVRVSLEFHSFEFNNLPYMYF